MAKEGVKRGLGNLRTVPWSPQKLLEFARGDATLAEVEGISDEALLEAGKMGYDFMENGDLERAEQVFMGLIALDPYNAWFHLAMGSVHQRREEFEQAEARYTRSLSINGYSVEALCNRGEVRLRLGKNDDAMQDFERAIDADGEENTPHAQRARVILEQLRAEAAGAPSASE